MTLALQETKLIVAKALWAFDIELAPGQKPIDFERDFRMYGMLEKPDVRVRFHPVAR